MYNEITSDLNIFSKCTFKYFMKCLNCFLSLSITRTVSISPVEDEYIRIIGTTPETSTSFSPIGRNIVIPQANCFSKIKPVNNWQYFGQHNSSYYQPQPATDS